MLLSALPLDLLRLVFAYLPVRPRFTVASFVCKRWRDAVRSSITRHPRGMPLRLAIDLLPSLHHARIGSVPDGLVALPDAIRSLKVTAPIGHKPGAECPLSGATHLRSLTWLTSPYGDGQCEHLHALLANNGATLTHLTVSQYFPCPAQPLAALTSLATSEGSALLPAYCSALTALNIFRNWLGEPALPISPLVQTLRVRGMLSQDILLRFPALKSLDMPCIREMHRAVPSGIGSTLTGLCVEDVNGVLALAAYVLIALCAHIASCIALQSCASSAALPDDPRLRNAR